MDFVHGQLVTGRKIRVLTVVGMFSRFPPVLDPRFSYRGEDVVQTLEVTCAAVGYPKTIRVDQGSEFMAFLNGRNRGARYVVELEVQHQRLAYDFVGGRVALERK